MPFVYNSPTMNSKGQIAHGITPGGVYLDNVKLDEGGEATWLTETVIVYQRNNGGVLNVSSYDTIASPPVITQLNPWMAPTLGGNLFGSWGAWNYSDGLFTSSDIGFSNRQASIMALGADASVAYCPDAGNQSKLVLRKKNGVEITLNSSSEVVRHVNIVGAEQVVWVQNNVLKSYGMPAITVLTGGVWTPKAIVIKGKWWIAYYSGSYGVVLHPIDSTLGYKPTTNTLFDIRGLAGRPSVIRMAWATDNLETHVDYIDIDTDVDPKISLGTPAPPPGGGTGPTVPPTPHPPGLPYIPGAPPPPGTPGTTGGGEPGSPSETPPSGVRTLTTSASFGVAAAAEEMVTLPLEIFPAYPIGEGNGRIIHPILGAFDYEVKPDEWVNIDADAIIPPVWASSRTLTSAANVLWNGNLRDVVVEERWKALGGLAMPVTQLRMLLAIWTMPIDPDVGYVYWYPNYITGIAFKVLPINLTAGGQGITFDDVVNYKDDYGDPIGWVTAPVTFQLKLVERV